MSALIIFGLIVVGALAVLGVIAIGVVLCVTEEPTPNNVIDINSRRGK